MMDTNIGDVIATRTLTVVDEPSTIILVTLTKPVPYPEQYHPGQNDHYCLYQITGVGNERIVRVGGVDAFQALELSFRAIGAQLAALNRDMGGRLRWECDDHGWLGFPVPTDA